MRVLLPYGGVSAENPVSRVSASYVGGLLERYGHEVVRVEITPEGSWELEGEPLSFRCSSGAWGISSAGRPVRFDLVFPVLHGPGGEDGTVQGLCEAAGWPCAGCGVLASALAMDKVTMRMLAEAAGIPVLPWTWLTWPEVPSGEDLERLGMPLFVKPSRMGSSVGISRVDSPTQLEAALELASGYDRRVVLESCMEPARELEVAVVRDSSGLSTSLPGEILPGESWYSYEAKYGDAGSRLLVPADLEERLSLALREAAARTFLLLGDTGFGRVDFLVDREGSLFMNEVNTIPGFTEISMFPKLWEPTGVPLEEVMGRILEAALDRARGEGPSGRTSCR